MPATINTSDYVIDQAKRRLIPTLNNMPGLGVVEKRLRERGVELWLAALNPEVLELLQRTPLAQALGRERMHFTVEKAVAEYQMRYPVP